jgi:cation diffusion facilitator family transporter
MLEGSKRAIVAAFAANLGLAVAKLVGFAITGAASMLAEAVHSLADTANQGLLLLGAARAAREATPEHPFGFGRERYFWAFIVAMLLFSMGSLFAIHEGVDKLRHPHELKSASVAIGILLLGIGLETWSFRTAVREARKVRGANSWWAFIRHSKTPELPVVLLEDLGALVGLVIALVGVGLAMALGNPIYDAMGSISIGVLLGAIAIVLATEMKSLLIGESASTEVDTAIRITVESASAVRRLIHMRTLHLGPDQLLVALKLELDADLDFRGVASAIDDVEAAIRQRVPIAQLIYIEPDIARAASGS